MKYLLYCDSVTNSYLNYDEETKSLLWEKSNEGKPTNYKVTRSLIADARDNLLHRPNDIEVIHLPENNWLRVQRNGQENILTNGRMVFGELITDEIKKDLNILRTNGGVLIVRLLNTTRRIVFYATNNTSTKKTDKGRQAIYQEANIFEPVDNNDYYEAVVRIPKKISTENNDLIRRVFDLDTAIFKKVQELSLKVDIIKQSMNDFSDGKGSDKAKIESLIKQNESLLRDRAYLEREIHESEMIALNKIKQSLRFSKAAINRHVDLDGFPGTKLLLLEILKDLLKKLHKPDNDINELLGDKFSESRINEFCDNIDSKIQSLQEIKKEFITLNIINRTGGED
ncbi:hypothetical protein SY88_04970 [Clostridiales bacterium PH28_bin88]|nr:hypothetical protein SY88_04970 [Clostridiales bacterium PH28_bin88]